MEGDNDLNIGMTGGELNERLAEYAEDDELRCCVVTGAGTRAFSAGVNLEEFEKMRPEQQAEVIRKLEAQGVK